MGQTRPVTTRTTPARPLLSWKATLENWTQTCCFSLALTPDQSSGVHRQLGPDNMYSIYSRATRFRRVRHAPTKTGTRVGAPILFTNSRKRSAEWCDGWGRGVSPASLRDEETPPQTWAGLMPFGQGPHRCIGQAWGIGMARVRHRPIRFEREEDIHMTPFR